MSDNSADNPTVTCDALLRPGMTGKERQARYRARLRLAGNVTVTVEIPAHCAPDILLVAEALREARHLTLGALRDPVSGQLVSAKSVLRRPRAAIA